LAEGETMYFPDFSPYQYGNVEPSADVLNVGWLSATHAFATGPADVQLIDALRKLIASPVELYRGQHYCEFCPEPFWDANKGRLVDAGPEARGSGEIRVVSASGVTYAAPLLVLHYVMAHSYRPPEEFIEAAVASAALHRGRP
jgi:hypothetical protein